MKLTVIHYTVLVLVFVALFVFKARKAQTESARQTNQSTRASLAPAAIDSTPDEPTPFGYKCIWFAVKATNAEEVVKEIGLTSPQRCNWKSGIAAAYQGNVFVTPPVGEWTLVVGQDLPTLDDEARQKETEALLRKLSKRFGEAQHFGTHRVVEFHAWAKASDGNLVREYAYLGERGEKLHDSGMITSEEQEVGIKGESEFFPDESHVMKVAGKWSLDPTTFSVISSPKGTGWLGTL